MLIHEASRSILLRVRNPKAIADVILQHRLGDFGDGYNIAVRHGLDEVKVLRNINIPAPSPILTQYDWPGKWHNKIMNHQRVTAEFLTLHRRGFVLNETGCVDATTEYLSPTGWKRIDQYDGGQVAQYDPETKQAQLVTPLEYVKKPCAEMIRFHTSRGVDQLLSAEHRVAYIASTGTFMVRPAHEIETAHHAAGKGWKGRFITTFSTALSTRVALTDAELRLQVAVIADGYFAPKSKTNWCIVRLKKERKKIRLRALLAAAGVEYTEKMPEYASAPGFSVFRFNAPLRLKEFDSRFWQASAEQLDIIASEVWRWDGSDRKAGGSAFFSTSKASADFVQYCFAATGRTASLGINEYNARGVKPLYSVHARADAALLYLCSSNHTESDNVRREPSPDGFKYCFEVPSNFLVLRRNGCIFITGNTMKTASSLWAADYLMSIGQVRKVLIVSTLSSLERTWLEEIFNVLMHRSAAVLHGDREKRLFLLNQDIDFYIINHDGLAVIQKDLRKRDDIDLIIVDEGSVYRNGVDNKGKYGVLQSLLKPTMRLWWLTATPCPNAPTDAYAQAKLIAPSRVPKYFGAFKRDTMLQITTYKWVAKQNSYETAYNAMQPAVRFKKADCLDLPPVVTEERTCDMSKEQAVAYQRMKAQLVLETTGQTITAVNAADQINKLRQILCGSVKGPDGEYEELDHTPRFKLLLECIGLAAAKVIVVVPFKGIVHALERQLSPHYSCAVMNGDVTPKNRNRIITEFKTLPDPHVLLCHPKVVAHSLNLTEADMLIFYAPIYSNDEAVQVIERFNRPGQTRKMTVIRMAINKLEFGIYAMLDGKQVSQMSILDLYNNEVLQ